ncbi:hypothetical protein PAAG_08194 [Paracoccidioides lutzii Pb01]|uniref:Uncharacterized protein n=1 Tax=Paracoccidioides lutzii (strain ATCC MYA-826 / Pb01) TaxID=502779 RepID=C1HBQ3_PARBA|nr:hypothetical protein PAAG_08194 [Paracoccidioides lutzii Pb01]EEH38467.2 hypothetical protein PAAG_08194 [Paracoccidioides lutzii Pb01]
MENTQPSNSILHPPRRMPPSNKVAVVLVRYPFGGIRGGDFLSKQTSCSESGEEEESRRPVVVTMSPEFFRAGSSSSSSKHCTHVGANGREIGHTWQASITPYG